MDDMDDPGKKRQKSPMSSYKGKQTTLIENVKSAQILQELNNIGNQSLRQNH